MKDALLHSSRVGFSAMIVVALVGGGIGALNALGQDDNLLNIVYLAWFPLAMISSIVLPILIWRIALSTWRQTKSLSTDIDPREARRWLMISVWVSTGIATLPFIVLTLILYILTLTTSPSNPGDGSALGMGQFFSMLCLFWNLFLIFVIGLIARSWIKREKTDQTPA